MRRCLLLGFLLAVGFGFTNLIPVEGGAGPPTVTLKIPSSVDFESCEAFFAGTKEGIMSDCQITRNKNQDVTISIMASDTHLRSGVESIPVGRLEVLVNNDYLPLTTSDQKICIIDKSLGGSVSFSIKMRITLDGTEAATGGYPPYSVGLIVTATM